MGNKSGVTANVIALPTGGGAVKGIGETFSHDAFTGTANFGFPIALPQGRNGFQPDLRLRYGSGTGNGPFGLGWSLNVPVIARKTSRGIPRYRDDAADEAERDTFILSRAEELVAVPGQAQGAALYRPRTEGAFARILRHRGNGGEHWEVQTPDGLVSWYGLEAGGAGAAVVANPDRPQQVFAWQLSRTLDPFGNGVEYRYERDAVQAEGPHRWDQIYLSEILYVDYGDPSAPEFLVKVRFVYEPRPDAFSDYRAGFEIRTVRRCSRIDVYTRQSGSFARTTSYNLEYLDQRGLPAAHLPANGASLLSRVKVTGHDGDRTESMPPLEFAYTPFEPEKRRYQPLTAMHESVPERSLSHPEYELADLFGNGLPDVIQLGDAARYWRNLGNGRFSLPHMMTDVPEGLSLARAGVQIADLDGDGRPDLLVTDGPLAGYYSLSGAGGWDRRGFRKYDQAPSINLEDPNVRFMDLDGDGVADALHTDHRFVLYYHDRERGWHKAEVRERGAAEEFPDVHFSDPRVRLADMTGDGLQDIVLIHDGRVEYWPYLGYGRWGKRITMRGAPRFADGGTYGPPGFDPKRLLVGDVDGDGLADLVYVEAGHVTVWINQAGNRWSDPVTIRGTPPVNDGDTVRLADMLGNGTEGILWTYDYGAMPDSTWKFLDLTGSVKPYLLCEIANQMGAVTRIGYSSSTRYYAEDETRPATRWQTALPFPVQVVDRVEVLDQLSGGKLTTTYRYRHGCWDGGEREFRGFGLVEQRDSEAFSVYNNPGLHGEAPFAPVGLADRRQFSPPALTRTWFHQGPVTDPERGWYVPDYSAGYWPDDRPLLGEHDLPRGLPPAARRDALRTLRGRPLRTELYGLDGSVREERPYTVTETRYGVRIEGAGVHFPHLLAQRTTHWDRGDDPATQFAFTWDYTPYGHPRRQLSVAVPRGRDPMAEGLPGPAEPYLATCTATDYAAADSAVRYLVDRVTRTTTREVRNDGSMSVPELLESVRAGTADLAVIGQTLMFYDGDPFTGLPFGQVGPYGALVRTEQLRVTEAILEAAYHASDPAAIPPVADLYWATSGAPAWPEEYPKSFAGLYPTDRHVDPTRPLLAITPLGYGFSEGGPDSPYARGYFVATQRRRYDFHGTGLGKGLALEAMDPLGQRTATAYDPYSLLPIRQTDAAGLVTTAESDYRTLKPFLVTDPNGNRTRAAYTPLGNMGSLAFLGKAGDGSGDTAAEPSIRFEMDLNAFAERRGPASIRTIKRVHHAGESDVPPAERSRTIITVEYSDGFGRLLQTRAQADETAFGDETFGEGLLSPDQAVLPGDAVGQPAAGGARVVVRGGQVYDNKGRVVERYEPFFAAGWDFAPPADGQLGRKVRMYYDPRGRLVRTVYPDGSEQRVVHGVPASLTDPDRFAPGPWESYTYDANDNAGRTHPGASAGYSGHWNTPGGVRLDALGRMVESVGRTGPAPTDRLVTRSVYDIRGNVLQVIDPLGRVAFTHVYDLANQVLRTESLDAGISRMVPDAAGKPVEARDNKGALVLRAYDSLGRPTRVWARDRIDRVLTLRELLLYGDTPGIELTPAQIAAANLAGRLYKHYDEAGLLLCEAYDFKGNLLEKVRRVIKDDHLRSIFNNSGGNDGQVPALVVDWEPPGRTSFDDHRDGILDRTEYRVTTAFDALGRMKHLKLPRDVGGGRRIIRPRYNRAGALRQVECDGKLYVEHIAYSAGGQRTLIAYGRGAGGRGVMTRYAYDGQTARLVRMRTEQYTALPGPVPAFRPTAQGSPLQEYGYAYDLTGNLLTLRDRTPGSGIPGTLAGRDALDRQFAHDPLYRLRSATGRECDLPSQPAAPWSDQPRCIDMSRTRAYTERYEYDSAGNLRELSHTQYGAGGAVSGYSRHYEPAAGSNRLRGVSINNATLSYTHDACGNLVQENSERHFQWDHANRLRVYSNQTGKGQTTLHAQYLYDAGGQRVIKFVRLRGGTYETTIYIDGIFEHRRWHVKGKPRENNLLHIMDSQSRIAVRRIGERHPDDQGPDIQFHLGDHLGSSNLVLDESGAWTNREEYTPYGETSFGSFSLKRYRFTGKERDSESGLCYHGARYYAPWLGRWVSCDPAGVVDGTNPYAYVRAQPLRFVDPAGMQAKYSETEQALQQCITSEHLTNVPPQGSESIPGTHLLGPYLMQKGWEMGEAFKQSDPDWFKKIDEYGMKTFKQGGYIDPLPVQKPVTGPLAEEQMTARHGSYDKRKKFGTGRVSFTKDIDEALRRGERSQVVRVNPDEVRAAGAQFKDTDDLLKDLDRLVESRGGAANSDVRASRSAYTYYQEGHVVGRTPPGTVKPLVWWQGRQPQIGATVGTAGGLVLGGLQPTTYQTGTADPFDPHFGDVAGTETEYFLGLFGYWLGLRETEPEKPPHMRYQQ